MVLTYRLLLAVAFSFGLLSLVVGVFSLLLSNISFFGLLVLYVQALLLISLLVSLCVRQLLCLCAGYFCL